MPARLVVSLCCAFVFLTIAAGPLSAENWPQFRGNQGNATADKSQPPLKWNATKNIAWKSALPGRGASSPVTWGDRVFLTAYTGFGTDETKLYNSLKAMVYFVPNGFVL